VANAAKEKGSQRPMVMLVAVTIGAALFRCLLMTALRKALRYRGPYRDRSSAGDNFFGSTATAITVVSDHPGDSGARGTGGDGGSLVMEVVTVAVTEVADSADARSKRN
jgi:hypothetical protein